LIARFSAEADPIRIKLAQNRVVELNRPGQALELIAEVDPAKLPEPQALLAKKSQLRRGRCRMKASSSWMLRLGNSVAGE
jgi:hypothetical protein